LLVLIFTGYAGICGHPQLSWRFLHNEFSRNQS
jgi:hypothetical protein